MYSMDDANDPLFDRIDKALMAFRREWKARGTPRLADYLKDWAAEHRAQLLDLLLEEDLYQRSKCGDLPEVEEYLDQFGLTAQDQLQIRQIFAEKCAAVSSRRANSRRATTSLSARFPRRRGALQVAAEVRWRRDGRSWEAEQLEPFRRRVAIKFIKGNINASDILARFELEGQVRADGPS